MKHISDYFDGAICNGCHAHSTKPMKGEWYVPTNERLPKGWERFDREDNEPLYRDEDYNEYVKDEYGKFVPVEND